MGEKLLCPVPFCICDYDLVLSKIKKKQEEKQKGKHFQRFVASWQAKPSKSAKKSPQVIIGSSHIGETYFIEAKVNNAFQNIQYLISPKKFTVCISIIYFPKYLEIERGKAIV